MTWYLLFQLITNWSSVRAENNPFVKTYIGITNSRVCGIVSRDDVKALGKDCPPYPGNTLFTTSEALFEWTIFQTSANLQLQKNKCIIERSEVLLKSDHLMEQWINALTVSWLGKRKSELILQKCKEVNFNTNERIGARLNIGFTPRSTVDPQWLKICEDPNTLVTLSSAANIFEYSLPITSSPQFFDNMESHRDAVIYKKTGKPITNEEILNSDITNLSFILLDSNELKSLVKDITKDFKAVSDERKEMRLKILSTREPKNKTFNIDDATKEYIFDDDTVFEVLEKTGQLESDFITGDTVKMSNGAKCILNHYEHSFDAEITELLALSIFFSKVISKAFSLPKIKNLKSYGKAIGSGSIPAGVFQALREAMKTCGNSQYQDVKLKDQNKTQRKVFIEGDQLPKEVGFNAFDIKDFPDNKTPACKGLGKNLMLSDFKHSSCIVSSLFTLANAAPLALPLIWKTVPKQ